MKITISQGINPTMYENQITNTEGVESAAATSENVEAKTNDEGMTFAETLQAIDSAIAAAKEKGQSGLDINSDAARALGLMAYGSSYAYASLVNNSGASTTYNEALTNLTQRYSSYTRDMMGYKGDSASDYGGDLACSDELNAYFDEAARTYNVDVKLLKSVAKAESSFRTDAVSSAGAQGIMQLMPSTASGLGVTNSFDPYQNIMGGAKYLGALLDTFNGNASYAVAGYNAGGSRVTQYGGIPPFAETQKYVVKVLGYYEGVSYSADATSAGSLSTISAGNPSTAANSTEGTLTADEIQDMIEKAVAEALQNALANAISDSISSALSSSIQSAVQESMSEIAQETLGDWLSSAVEETLQDILAKEEADKSDATTEVVEETEEVQDEIPTEIIEDVPVEAPLEVPEEVQEETPEIAPVEETDTGASTSNDNTEE